MVTDLILFISYFKYPHVLLSSTQASLQKNAVDLTFIHASHLFAKMLLQRGERPAGKRVLLLAACLPSPTVNSASVRLMELMVWDRVGYHLATKEKQLCQCLRKRWPLFCYMAQSILLPYPSILNSGDLCKVSEQSVMGLGGACGTKWASKAGPVPVGEIGREHAAASLCSVIRANDRSGVATYITLGQGHNYFWEKGCSNFEPSVSVCLNLKTICIKELSAKSK